jgi:hypothetical protein
LVDDKTLNVVVKPDLFGNYQGSGTLPVSALLNALPGYAPGGVYIFSVEVTAQSGLLPIPAVGEGELVNVLTYQVDVESAQQADTPATTLTILVLGDSILWGQGLAEEHKLHSILESHLLTSPTVAAALGKTPIVKKVVFAHSGAPLGTLTGKSGAISAGNITASPPGAIYPSSFLNAELSFPLAEPPGAINASVFDQLWSYFASQEIALTNMVDPSVSFVLVDGGINDVGLTNLLNPYTSQSQIIGTTDTACGTWMQTLLGLLLAFFPNATIFVTGYYDIATRFTNLNGLEFAIAGVCFAAAGIVGVIVGSIMGSISLRLLLSNLNAFATESAAQLQASVNAAVNTFGGAGMNGTTQIPRVYYIQPQIEPDQAIFAGNSNGDDKNGPTQALLWGFDPSVADISSTIEFWMSLGASLGGLNGMIAGCYAGVKIVMNELTPVDEVESMRLPVCASTSGGLFCQLASVGHPNIQGEQAYATPLLQVVDQLFGDLLALGGLGSLCMIATAAFGSARSPQVEELRRVRDSFLRSSRLASEFFSDLLSEYYAFSPTVASAMRASPQFKESVTALLVNPFLSFLEIVGSWLSNPTAQQFEVAIRTTLEKSLLELAGQGIGKGEIPSFANELARLRLPTTDTRRTKVQPTPNGNGAAMVVDYINSVLEIRLTGKGPHLRAALLDPLQMYGEVLIHYARQEDVSTIRERLEGELAAWLGGMPIPKSFVKLGRNDAKQELVALSRVLFTQRRARHRFGQRFLSLKEEVGYDLRSLLADLDYLPPN